MTHQLLCNAGQALLLPLPEGVLPCQEVSRQAQAVLDYPV